MTKQMKVLEKRQVLGVGFKVYGTFEEPLFLAKDVAEWLEHKKPNELVNLVDENEKLMAIVSHSGQGREMWFLTEDGLYEILFQSRKPIAKRFKKEVKRILKDIRINGYKQKAERDTLEWQQQRAIGKLSRKAETDVLKKLVVYAKEQGSDNAEKYYMHYSKLVKKLVGGYKNRDFATLHQLETLTMLDKITLHCVADCIDLDMHYKEIYKICKKKLETYMSLTYFDRQEIA